jgi:uncharacterized protein
VAKLPKPIAFDWDKGNLEKNWQQHKVHFREAEEAFMNIPLKIFKDKNHSQLEERYLALGVSNSKRRLSLVFTVRAEKIRIISARDQSKKERTLYEKKKRQ